MFVELSRLLDRINNYKYLKGWILFEGVRSVCL